MSIEDVNLALWLILVWLILLTFAPLILVDGFFVVGVAIMVWRVFIRPMDDEEMGPQ